MTKNAVAEAAVQLRIATRKACMCEKASDKKKNTLSLESKILFLIRNQPLCPIEIIDALQIQKTNLAALSRRMENEGMLDKERLPGRREIVYRITEKGLRELDLKLSVIEKNFAKFLGDEKDYAAALDTINAALRLLSFLSD